MAASFTQSIEAGGAGVWGILFFEHWGEQREIRALSGGLSYLGRGVTRNGDYRSSRMSDLCPNLSYFRWRQIVSRQMDSVRAASEGDVAS